MLRRTFVQSSLLSAAAATLSGGEGKRLPIAMAVEYSMLPENLSPEEKFAMAKRAGFEQMECPTVSDEAEAHRIKAASERTGIKIHSVMNSDHWKYPFSSSDSAVVEKSVEGARTSIRNAKLWGATTVLLVPAVVNEHTSYAEAYKRSQPVIRKLVPMAQEHNVILGIEEVWNKFLLSPLEMARYVDEFESPFVRAYFDVGNVVLYGYPQDWIRTLGKRIVKLHFKDFSFHRDELVGKWQNLGDGEIDWPQVYAALGEIGYQGSGTVELEGGDEKYLTDVCGRFKRILSGDMPRNKAS